MPHQGSGIGQAPELSEVLWTWLAPQSRRLHGSIPEGIRGWPPGRQKATCADLKRHPFLPNPLLLGNYCNILILCEQGLLLPSWGRTLHNTQGEVACSSEERGVLEVAACVGSSPGWATCSLWAAHLAWGLCASSVV